MYQLDVQQIFGECITTDRQQRKITETSSFAGIVSPGGLWISMTLVFLVETDLSFGRDGEAQVSGAVDTSYFLRRIAGARPLRIPINAKRGCSCHCSIKNNPAPLFAFACRSTVQAQPALD